MKMGFTVRNPVLSCLLTIILMWIKGISAQSNAWTLNNPSVSYIGFSPQYSTGQNQHLQLKFRTRQSNGLLFHHHFQEYNKDEFPLLYHYQLYAELRQGYLRVGHQVNQYSQLATLGQGLNDDKWHTFNWFLDSKDGLMIVSVDDLSTNITLEAFGWGQGREILQWSLLPSTISYGATNASNSQEFFHFIGCLSDMKYEREDSILIDIPIQTIAGITRGCNDLCADNNQCQNGGRCINMYTRTKCDCFGTNYEGNRCDTKGPTSMTFRGYEWIQYKLYDKKEDRLFSDNNRISLEFKTGRGSGVLLYAVGGTPYHTHVTASIHGGKLHTSISFGDHVSDLEFNMGLGLDDNRWHNLTIVHIKRSMYVYLNGKVEEQQVTSDQYFLSLDPNVYIGGGHNFVETRGLQITQSFVGCLRNVYFNDVSVLYNLKSGKKNCEYQGGRSAQYGCDPIQEIPITFPMAGSMLRWDVPKNDNLSVSFRFRTVREMAILFSVELLARDGFGGYEYGYLEVWVKEGKPFLSFVPSTRNRKGFRENQSIPAIVNNSQWHTLNLTLHSRTYQDIDKRTKQTFQAKLKVDQSSIRTNVYRKPLEHRGKLIFGFGLRGYKRTDGFVGCIEGLVVQGIKIDPIKITETEAAVGLRLDGCNLKDYCSNNNICEHDSICLSDWNGVQCDCSEHYEGKACHFPKYPKTCDDYFQSGRNVSGVYIVDLDGSGPLEPTYVHCEMGEVHDDNEYGETVIEHNFQANTTIRKNDYADRQYHLLYRGMSTGQLSALTTDSAACKQQVQYYCYQSPLRLGKRTWFKAANGEIVDYIGSDRAGFCDCDQQDMCQGERCYCDHGKDVWKQDEGFNTIKKQLPLTEVTVLQNTQGEGKLSIGPLKCWGSVHVPLDKSITFIKSSSYIMLHSWKKGDLRINIKTDQTNALILYQTPGKGNSNSFYIKIISANEVQFRFKIGGKIILETLYTPKPLDIGDWHTIIVEHDKYNLRLAVDQKRLIFNLKSDITKLIDFSDGILYIGGLPDGIASELGETSPGLTGCVRGFVYNNKVKDLTRLIDSSMTGVTSDCMSSCWPNPCKNGGVCEERWGSYNCVCANKWVHYGENCERDINLDAVTFSGEETGYLRLDMTEYPQVLDQTIIFSFRTFQQDALLLYAHDHMNNFMQVELQQGTTITVSYNNFNQVIRENIKFDGRRREDRLNDGKWKQVIAQIVDGNTELIVEDKSTLIYFKRIKLQKYSTIPYKQSPVPESVFLHRPPEQPDPFVHLYIGGVPKMATTLPTIKGCMRGLKIGDRIVSLKDKALLDKSGELTPACETGCIKDRCLNGGYCTEEWKSGEYTCDCGETDYSGQQCQIEPSAKFDGDSVLEHKFLLPSTSQRSLSEQLSFMFTTNGTKAKSEDGDILQMAMIYVRSSKNKDYILAKMDYDGSVIIETKQEIGIYRMKVPQNFANGKPHELKYRRDGTDMYVTLDGIQEATMNYPAFDLDEIDMIYVGGVIGENDDLYNLVNFTGCVSNVVYVPSKTSLERIRTLKDLYNGGADITSFGKNITSCSAKQLTASRIQNTPKTTDNEFDDYEMVTMPAWNVRSAVAVIIGLPVVPVVIITTPSLVIPANNTLTLIHSNTVDSLTIVIAVSIIASSIILAIIIAFLLIRRRKRMREYDIKKEKMFDADYDVKVPLNHVDPPIPTDHLAKLDEFSMVSATLGPRMRNHVSADPINRNSHGSFPMIDDETAFNNTIYNKRKNRPASSISEVLEELERRQKTKEEVKNESEDVCKTDIDLNRAHGEGELEWDPQVDKAPLTYGEITFFDTPLLLSIPDNLEELEMSASSSIVSLEKKEEDLATEDSGNPNSNGEYNGDSGYEAESRPEGMEDEATPDTTIDDSPQKMYMYDISGVDLQASPNLSVHQKLLPAEPNV
ncbi:axotactin isoform X2 [Patella vulgata]|uniref:axotactin isoform X2 n=1 Tax=Patella vulgata TaxID=6465 RepID=UPI0024A9D86A|nr:axotactin isoform X2 [Patella vulgata]